MGLRETVKAFAIVASLGGGTVACEGDNARYIEDCREQQLAVDRLGETISRCASSLKDDNLCKLYAIRREKLRRELYAICPILED